MLAKYILQVHSRKVMVFSFVNLNWQKKSCWCEFYLTAETKDLDLTVALLVLSLKKVLLLTKEAPIMSWIC